MGVVILLGAIAGMRSLFTYALAYLLIASASLVCSIIFLTYTVSPRARAASCGGNRNSCVGWGCDLSWDCFWAMLWALEVGLSIYTAIHSRRPGAILHVVFSVGMFALYVATAAMVGKVRESVKWQASKDVEAGNGGGVGVKPGTTAPLVVQV